MRSWFDLARWGCRGVDSRLDLEEWICVVHGVCVSGRVGINGEKWVSGAWDVGE